ncbi:MAG: hypothetical protein GX221_01830 [Candidatus Riflebacteria bacterium]|nr:hypothetical protein [Candidatus Riflebacteria bacterium]
MGRALSKPLPGSPNLTFLGCHVAEDVFASSLAGLRIILECSYRFDTKSPDKLKVFGGITFIDPDGIAIKAKHQDFVYPYDESKTLIGGKTIITKENLGDNNEKLFHISLFVPYGILESSQAPKETPLESLFLLADLETIPENSEISEKKRQYYILNYSNKDVYSYQFLHPETQI